MIPAKKSLKEAFASFTEHWSPRIAAEVNGMQVRVVKLQGDFVWHKHEDDDEFFLVHRGELTLKFRDGEVTLGCGEFVVVPRGAEHCPVASEECELILFERGSLVNTGDVENQRTVTVLKRL